MVGLEGAGEEGRELQPIFLGNILPNSFLKRTALPYVRPSFEKIGASASLSAKSSIKGISLISSSAKRKVTVCYDVKLQKIIEYVYRVQICSNSLQKGRQFICQQTTS